METSMMVITGILVVVIAAFAIVGMKRMKK
jgi:uncharacterized membrane protein required for colicin V production